MTLEPLSWIYSVGLECKCEATNFSLASLHTKERPIFIRCA